MKGLRGFHRTMEGWITGGDADYYFLVAAVQSGNYEFGETLVYIVNALWN